MNRHRIGQRAIAIEDVPGETAIRNIELHPGIIHAWGDIEEFAVNHIDAHSIANPALRSFGGLPGPRQLPFLGNLHQVDLKRLHCSIECFAERYGDYFRLRLGRRELLVVADPIAIGRMLRDRPEGFRRTRLLEAVFRELGIAGVFATNGEVWRAQRKMVVAAFDPRHIKAYFPSLTRVTERLYRRWSAHAMRGTEFDLQAELMRYTVDVVAGLAFGVDFNTIESESDTIQTHLNRIFPMLQRRLLAPVPYWHWIRLPADRALERSLSHVRQAITALISEARRRLDRDPKLRDSPANLIEAMLVERDAPGTVLTDYDVSSNILTMLLAGEDTTANTLAWLVHLVSREPAVTRRLEEEADRVLQDARWAGRIDLVSAHSYAAACAHETMRLKPVAPMIILEALNPTVVGDVAVPTGTVIMALMRRGAMDPVHFERPGSFDPTRWLDAGTAADAGAGPGNAAGQAVPTGMGAATTARGRISMPFGGGPRICPGRNLALLEISLVTSMLYRNFEVASIRTADGASVQEFLDFTMAPSKLLVTLTPRDAHRSKRPVS